MQHICLRPAPRIARIVERTARKMASPPSPKRQKSTAALTGPLIGTHSGTFHADEALAVYILRSLPAYRDSPVLRTRDPAQLATCHTVVDVGATYDASTHRYDHHQREFSETFPSHGTKLSSAGLVWLHFGPAFIGALQPGLSAPDTDLVWQRLYKSFIEAVDANDNGISAYGSEQLRDGAQPRFDERGFTLAGLVSDMNHDDADGEHGFSTAAPGSAQAAEDAKFAKASTLMGSALVRKVRHAAREWLPARAAVQDAYGSRHAKHPSGRIVVLTAGGVPWKEHLYNAEEAELRGLGADRAAADEAVQRGEAPENLPGREVAVYYVLYPESDAASSKWRVQCVPVSSQSFESRRPLKEEWRGVRDEQLSEVAGIEGCVFCHASGFIGGNLTYEGALKMAEKSLDGDKGFVFPQ